MIVYKIITLWIEAPQATNLAQEWSSVASHWWKSPAISPALSWRGRRSKLRPERAWQADLTLGDVRMASWLPSTWVPLICQIFTECLRRTDNGAGATKHDKGEVWAPRELIRFGAPSGSQGKDAPVTHTTNCHLMLMTATILKSEKHW